jgi:DNA recombination protein RmuC
MNPIVYVAVGGVAVGVFIGVAIANYFFRSRKKDASEIIALAKEKLSTDKEEIKTDLEGKKDAIKTLVEEIRKQLHDTNRQFMENEKERVTHFAELKKELEQNKQLAHELRGSTEQLKNVLSNNQMRGAFGERVAEDLLRVAGFVINQDYLIQTAVGPSRPDFTLILPDKCKVNIDVKFPYQNLQKYTEAKDEQERKVHFTQFQRDVREKIKQIATRDYINPDDNTVDFAVAFIPNEMIFSFIYEQMNDVWEEAMSKKVILAGPYSFVALLRLVKQAHSNFRMQSNIHQVIQLVQKFRQEYEKFSGELDVLGARIDSAAKQFQSVSSTRSRQLGRVMDQIDSQHVLEDTPKSGLLE